MAHVHGAASAANTNKLAAHAVHSATSTAAKAPAALSFHNLGKGAATGVVATASAKAKKSFLGKVFSHPLVLFGLGLAAGYAIHKYRKEIIESTNRAAEKGKDFVLQQRENLEDLVGEAGESAN